MVIITRKPKGKAESKYPRLMEHEVSGTIILMTSPGEGFVLYSESDLYDVGTYRNNWSMGLLDHFKREIVLSNQ